MDTTLRSLVGSERELLELLAVSGKRFYVYVLYTPNPKGYPEQPFYVGIGRDSRLFDHEREARDPTAGGARIEAIRRLWREGREVVRVIDSLHDREPWEREEALINQWGLLKDGTGILTNEQRYAPAHSINGVELRKYARHGNNLPPNFHSRHLRLGLGARRPRNPNSVYGKICAVIQQHPGVTGEELVELLLRVDFTGNKSAYTKSGEVSRPWLAKYIDGGFYKKNQGAGVSED